ASKCRWAPRRKRHGSPGGGGRSPGPAPLGARTQRNRRLFPRRGGRTLGDQHGCVPCAVEPSYATVAQNIGGRAMNWTDELRRIPAPEPSKDLLERILASRAAGVRVALPHERSPVSRRAALLLTAAAAAGILVMTTRGGDRRPVAPEIGYQDIAAGLSFWPPDAMAQEAGPPRRPRYEPVHNLRVARAHGGTWTYRTCTVFDNVLTKCRGRLTIAIREAKWEGRPAWLISQQQKSVRDWSTMDTIRTPLDTTYVDPATLRPMYHVINGKAFHFVRRV